MKAFLKRKNIHLSAKTYLVDALGSVAFGLFATLLVGTILNSIGNVFDIPFLTDRLFPLAQLSAGPAIAVAIALSLQADRLILLAIPVVGLSAYESGGVIGVYLSSLIAIELAKIISKETKLDIIVTPAFTLLIGVLLGDFIGAPIGRMTQSLGELIVYATNLNPFLMGILISLLIGLALTLPISSAAICMMLGLNGLAAGAATVGCSCQMIGFAVISYKDNGLDGMLAQGLGTSMFQVGNILKNPWIWLPPSLASVIIAPLATMVFKMENSPLGAGMGTSGLVGQIATLSEMAPHSDLSSTLLAIALLHFILPGLISYITYKILYKYQLIKDSDMKIDFSN